MEKSSQRCRYPFRRLQCQSNSHEAHFGDLLSIPKNEGGKKIAVLADMKELGEQSVQLHTQMILSLTPDAIDTVIFYGEDIAELSQLASQMFPLGHVYYFKKTADEDQFDAMVKQIKESLGEHDQILLKGSNSMNLAKVVEELQAKN